MTTCFITTRRPTPYIGLTLDSIRDQSEFLNPKVFSDLPISELGANVSGVAHEVVEIDHSAVPRWKATRVAAHILHPSTGPEGDVLLCEDDLMFTRSFDKKLCDCLAAIPVDDYLLTLYWPGPLGDKVIEHVNPSKWHGSQAVYVQKSERERLAMFLRSRLEHGLGVDYTLDLALAEYCRLNNLPLFASNPSLVQHIGLVSVCSPWLSGRRDHQSPTFVM